MKIISLDLGESATVPGSWSSKYNWSIWSEGLFIGTSGTIEFHNQGVRHQVYMYLLEFYVVVYENTIRTLGNNDFSIQIRFSLDGSSAYIKRDGNIFTIKMAGEIISKQSWEEFLNDLLEMRSYLNNCIKKHLPKVAQTKEHELLFG